MKKEIRTLRTAFRQTRMGFLSRAFPSGLMYSSENEPLPDSDGDRTTVEGFNEEQAAQLWETLYPNVAGDRIAPKRTFRGTPRTLRIHPDGCYGGAYWNAANHELIRMRKLTWISTPERCSFERRSAKKANGRPDESRSPQAKRNPPDVGRPTSQRPHLFCHAEEVARSRKRSRTTGHKNTKHRPTTIAGRMADVTNRERRGFEALTPNEASDHSASGPDGEGGRQRMAYADYSLYLGMRLTGCRSEATSEWCGHMTTEISRRYAHLKKPVCPACGDQWRVLADLRQQALLLNAEQFGVGNDPALIFPSATTLFSAFTRPCRHHSRHVNSDLPRMRATSSVPYQSLMVFLVANQPFDAFQRLRGMVAISY